MPLQHSTPGNEALAPVAAGRRVFRGRDHAALWFSLGVGLLVMQVGAALAPGLGTQQALLVIVAGSVLGAGLLGWVAKIGCDSGLASAALMHAVYGRGFARLPVALNIVQLAGWGSFELVVMRDASAAIGAHSAGLTGAHWPLLATLFWGGVVMLLLAGSMLQLVRRLIARVALPLVLASLLWLTWQFLAQAQAQTPGTAGAPGLQALWQRQGAGGMGALTALDLVLAMPISWLPLVADYARHGRSGAAALRGTWLGYALANIWCYALGVLVALSLPGQALVQALLLAQGGLVALSLILIDEVDNAWGDAYSGAVCAHSLAPRLGVRAWGLLLAALCTALALLLPMHGLEPFLLLLSSVFVPLFGVILGRLAFGADALAALAAARAVHWPAVAIWLAGVAVYHLAPLLSAAAGAALPALAFSFGLALLTRPRPSRRPAHRPDC